MNSKQKGNITEVESMLSFLKLGYNVLQPYGDCERYDFVVDVNNKFYKIQCKTASTKDNGNSIEFNCRSSHRVNGKCKNEKYTSEDVDFFITTWNGKSYLVPINECSNMKTLRFTNPKNNQSDNISFAKDYELETVIKKL